MQISSAQLHKKIDKREKEKYETVQEYFLVMEELFSRNHIETIALIQYVIDGISDDISRKVILFGARKLNEFNDKLRTYEEISKKEHHKEKTIPGKMISKGRKLKIPQRIRILLDVITVVV